MDVFNLRTLGRAAVTAMAGISLAGASPALARKAPEPPVEYGPPPNWERFKELAEQAVRMRLVDPDSAKFSWMWGYQQGFYKPMLAKRVHGYTSCALVNARNRMGGYTGDTYFVVVIDDDMVRYVEIAQNQYGLINEQCLKANLPMAAEMQPVAAPKPNYGIAFFVAPEGIRVDRVFPGSPAELAGIKAGMVIAKINGLTLKGLSQPTAQQVLGGLTGNAVMELASGAVITVARP